MKVKTLDHRLLRRQCVACGFDRPRVRSGNGRYCPRCGCDLRERPPRSYAEMEGLEPMPLEAPVADPPRAERLGHRWLVFLFFAALVVLAIVYLASAAISV